jgi:hypothetical protein
MQLAKFECGECDRTLIDELPPILWVEAWPACCGRDAYLIEIATEEEVAAHWAGDDS